MIPIDILNYRVVRHLGTGGMGSVYLAVNTNIDQQVAIKVLKPEFANNPVLRARLKMEAEMLCSLDHPGIVKFLNYVENASGVFLIMEYVSGITLEDFIQKKNGLIVESKAYPFISELLDAFSYAHSKGIVHRDIKPSNIFIQDDGHIKVMDFGIAQIVSESNSEQGNRVMGTPTFMSPEQVYGRKVDARSDIYSLGVLIHNMLTGRAPYDSTTLSEFEIKHRVTMEILPRMKSYYPYISDGIQLVVDKATNKDPEGRYQDCQQMKAAVKKAIAPDPISKPLLYGGIAAAVIICLAGFFTWNYFRTKVSYYKDYVEVFGIPKGIGSLSSNEASHREGSYRFEYNKHKLRRVSFVNSEGNLIDHHDSEDVDRIIDMTIFYSEGSDRVDVEKYYDRNGKVLYVKDFDSKFKTCTFKLDDELGTEMTLNSQVNLFENRFDINNLSGKSRISKYILEYDEDGRLAIVEFAGFGNIRVADGQGLFGRRYVYDEKGRVVEEHYLGRDRKPKATQFGLGIKRFTYDENDCMSKIEYLTVDGEPSSDGNNCPVVLLTYDKWGNRQSERYTDKEGKPMVRKDNSLAGFDYEYDDKGHPTRHRNIGLDGRTAYYVGNAGCRYEYDENGYRSLIQYVDASDKNAYCNDDDHYTYSRVVIENDAHGNAVKIDFYTTDGKPVTSFGHSGRVNEYDSLGNTLMWYYTDTNRKPSKNPVEGYAGMKFIYNEQGRMIKYSYIDENKKKIIVPQLQYSSYKRNYDARGNIINETFLDENDSVTTTISGYATISFEYDENGNQTSFQYYGKDGKPCIKNGECSKMGKVYDDQGNVASERYYSTNGKLMSIGGIAGYDYQYDSRGNIISKLPVGTFGSLAEGYREERNKYDERDNIVEQAFFGKGGRPVACDDGYHKSVMKYNSRNQLTEVTYFNTSGKRVNLSGQAYSKTKLEYDSRGNKVGQTFYNASDDRGTDMNGVHKYFNQYDIVSNQVSHQISFGKDGKPVAAGNYSPEGRVKYDNRGNQVSLTCLDGYGKDINGNCGWHEVKLEYTDAGLPTSQTYYSLDGKPAIDTNTGFHKLQRTYNSFNLVETETMYGKNGKPIMINGFSQIKYKYNNLNQLVEFALYDSKGRRTNCDAGWHRQVFTYKLGSQSKKEFFDVNGRKIGSSSSINNKWTDIQWNSSSNGSNQLSWQDALKAINQECPVDFDEEITLSSLTYSDESVYFTIRDLQAKDGEITEERRAYLEIYFKNLTDNFRTLLNIPKKISISWGVYDEEWECVAVF